MKRPDRKLEWMALAVSCLLTGCGSTPAGPKTSPSAEKSTIAAPVAALALPTAPPAQSTPPEPGSRGTVVFFRAYKFGGGWSFKVREGERELGELGVGNYFIVKLQPGPHEFTVHSEAKDVLNLEIEGGEIYYVLGTISAGVLVGRPNLSPSNEATFDRMKRKLKDSAASEK
jgi:hypothetical protein